MITENLSILKIHVLTQAQYERELAAGNIEPNQLYLTPDESEPNPNPDPEPVKTAEVTIVGDFDDGSYVRINGVNYKGTQTLTVDVGTTIECFVDSMYCECGRRGNDSKIYLNDQRVGNFTYNYVVVGDVEISVTIDESDCSECESPYRYSEIYITEM